ncbi:MAG: type II toxin-antitoxin system HicA family toxin [Chloroflexi bacterium]|nr:type II toxin-antitoxin system HicA family toxin [Chloroflexota bacterium]
MPRLPAISGKEAVDAFEKAGWRVARREGSHIILTKVGVPTILSVPAHREVRRGTLRSLIRKAGLSVEEFIALVRD